MEQYEVMVPEVINNHTPDHMQDREDERVFITANTVRSSPQELRESHIIPVFVKDNEPAISQYDFIKAMQEAVAEIYPRERVLTPNIRLSHPIKGRVPEARNKPAAELLDNEKTIYYERMMFAIEIASIEDTIDGNTLSLTVGGVKAYNMDNLYAKKGSDEHFKIFIGFKNRVCTNLCVWSDGYVGDLKVQNIGQLKGCINSLLVGYNESYHLFNLRRLAGYEITEVQFAHMLGKLRMYQYLPVDMKKEVHALMFGENQIATVCRDYYKDASFCRSTEGNINLWRLYNLFTEANKSTYIDSFLDRSVNAYRFAEHIRFAFGEPIR